MTWLVWISCLGGYEQFNIGKMVKSLTAEQSKIIVRALMM
jgi:hypothetical protein